MECREHALSGGITRLFLTQDHGSPGSPLKTAVEPGAAQHRVEFSISMGLTRKDHITGSTTDNSSTWLEQLGRKTCLAYLIMILSLIAQKHMSLSTFTKRRGTAGSTLTARGPIPPTLELTNFCLLKIVLHAFSKNG